MCFGLRVKDERRSNEKSNNSYRGYRARDVLARMLRDGLGESRRTDNGHVLWACALMGGSRHGGAVMVIRQSDIATLVDWCSHRPCTPADVIEDLISEYLECLEDKYPEEIDDEGIRADMRYERLCDERFGI